MDECAHHRDAVDPVALAEDSRLVDDVATRPARLVGHAVVGLYVERAADVR